MSKRTPAAQASPKANAPTTISRLRDLWLGTAARYTVIAICALFIGAISHESLAVAYVDALRFLLFLPFSVILTLAAWVRRSDKLSAGARIGLHPLLTLSGFYLCLYLPYQVQSKPSGQQVLLIVLLAILLYGIVMALYLVTTRRSRVAKRETVPYESQFKRSRD